MNINIFKGENELQGMDINMIREQIREEVQKDYKIRHDLELKEKVFKDNIVRDLKDFLTKELNFNVIEKDNLIFEFNHEGKVFKIEFTDNKYGMYIKHNFNNDADIRIHIDLKDFELNSLEWSLEDDVYSRTRELKYKHIEQKSVAWYKEQYNNVKESVLENIKTMDKIKDREIKDLFVITTEEKEYNNIIELIKEIIENN